MPVRVQLPLPLQTFNLIKNMNNVYFSNEGMTSTTANYYANIAKELQNAATERLNSIKFFKTSVAVIGSNEKQDMSIGTTDVSFIQEDLETLASMNAFCAWIREAIKEKEEQIKVVNKTNIDEWCIAQGIELPKRPEKYPRDPNPVTEQDIMDSWDINKRNKYLRLEATAATFGKYIHLDGAFNKARKEAHKRLNNPITKEGTGRDMILYYTEPSLDIAIVDGLFMTLQDQYREYEKELNQRKAEIKEAINERTRKAYDEYQIASDEVNRLLEQYNARYTELRAKFMTWRTNELERISKLKITVPNNLMETFNIIKAIGDTSK